MMAKFKWSASFWQLNGAYLAEYAACSDGAAVIAQQQHFMATLEAEAAARDAAKALAQNDYGSNWGLPSSSEEEEEEEEQVQGENAGEQDKTFNAEGSAVEVLATASTPEPEVEPEPKVAGVEL